MDRFFECLGWILLFVMTFIFLIGHEKLKLENKQEQTIITEYEKHPKKYETSYFGYLIFQGYNEKRIILYGDAKDVLSKSKIGIFGEVPVVVPKEPLILVGHSRQNQFSILHHLKQGDQIILRKRDYKYFYEVIEKEVIEESDTHFLKKIKDNMLVLITCMDDDNKRLIVYCQI